MPLDIANSVLNFNLLDEPLIRWRCQRQGELHCGSLPELFAAMAENTVRDFPALRPHQRHPWHAFLTQLAAIALHRDSKAMPWESAAEWRAALLRLTPDDPDGAAWCLVSPPQRPALMQAVVPTGDITEWSFESNTPDRLDMLITSRNHDLKQARMQRPLPEEWLFALISLQTQEGSNSGSYKGISRMNSGSGSRPGIGVALRDAIGTRWRSDISVLLRTRNAVADVYGLKAEDGVALAWLIPWDGVKAIRFADLDPYYIEICRQVRLEFRGRIVARTYKTPRSRVEENIDRKGRTGDPWTPINKAEAKILTISSKGFDYELMVDLIVGAEFTQAATQDLNGWPEAAQLELIAQGVARGNSKTAGYHERRIPIAPRMRRLLIGPQSSTVADIAKHRVVAIAAVRKLLWSALVVLFANGASGDSSDSTSNKAGRFGKPFEKREDARFFEDMGQEIEAEEAERANQRLNWMKGLVQRAEAVLREAFDAGPRNSMQRYKARAAALSRFHGGLRGAKPALPDLAHHYQQEAAARALEEEPHHA